MGLKIVVEVRSPYTDAQATEILKAIAAEGSFSHPAYAELQGRDSRLVVEVVGVVTAEDSPGDQLVMAVIPLTPDDDDFPIVCANGCPEGHLGRHKFSCDQARPR